jgi:hypothetical protein
MCVTNKSCSPDCMSFRDNLTSDDQLRSPLVMSATLDNVSFSSWSKVVFAPVLLGVSFKVFTISAGTETRPSTDKVFLSIVEDLPVPTVGLSPPKTVLVFLSVSLPHFCDLFHWSPVATPNAEFRSCYQILCFLPLWTECESPDSGRALHPHHTVSTILSATSDSCRAFLSTEFHRWTLSIHQNPRHPWDPAWRSFWWTVSQSEPKILYQYCLLNSFGWTSCPLPSLWRSEQIFPLLEESDESTFVLLVRLRCCVTTHSLEVAFVGYVIRWPRFQFVFPTWKTAPFTPSYNCGFECSPTVFTLVWVTNKRSWLGLKNTLNTLLIYNTLDDDPAPSVTNRLDVYNTLCVCSISTKNKGSFVLVLPLSG